MNQVNFCPFSQHRYNHITNWSIYMKDSCQLLKMGSVIDMALNLCRNDTLIFGKKNKQIFSFEVSTAVRTYPRFKHRVKCTCKVYKWNNVCPYLQNLFTVHNYKILKGIFYTYEENTPKCFLILYLFDWSCFYLGFRTAEGHWSSDPVRHVDCLQLYQTLSDRKGIVEYNAN